MDCLILKSYKKITEGFWWNRSSGGLQSNLLLEAGLAAKLGQVDQCLSQLNFEKSPRMEVPPPFWVLSGAWELELPLPLPLASCPYKVFVTPISSIKCDSIPLCHLLQGDQSHSNSGPSLDSQFCPCLSRTGWRTVQKGGEKSETNMLAALRQSSKLFFSL